MVGLQLDKKRLKKYAVAILLVVITVTFSGCTDKQDNPQDTVNVYVYEQMGEEGDPEEDIREFYDWASEQTGDEKAGPPSLMPVAEYAVEFDHETGDIIKIYNPDGAPVDPNDIPEDWQDLIVKDDAGNPITSASQLDLYIKPIGKDKYEILNLARELPVEDGVWRVSHEMGNKYSGDTKFNDNIFKIDDDLDDMYGGFVRGEDGKPYGVILVDEDTFELYGGDFGTKTTDKNAIGIDKEDCTYLGNGMYLYLFDLSEIAGIGSGVAVVSPHPIMEGLDITDKNSGFAQFMFIKEKL